MIRLNPKQNQGFTIIEMLIYIGLYSILISGVLVSVYSIKESGNRNYTKAFVIEEGIFLLSKISWALNTASSASTPTPSKIVIYNQNLPAPENPLTFEVSAYEMYLSRGNQTPQVLHGKNLKILNPVFEITQDSIGLTNLEKVSISFTISGNTKDGHPYSQDFSNIRYLRK